MHTIRKFIQKFGIDVHRYRKHTNRLDSLQKYNIKTIIDVGANVGQFKKEIREKLPNAFIYSFEPLAECFNKLKELEKKDTKFKAFNLALGNKNERTQINKSSYSLSSSLLPMSDIHKLAFPYSKDSMPESVEVKRMDDFFFDKKLDNNILIKVDTQGYESQVIEGGKETFSGAKVLIIETSFVPLYVGQQLFSEIYANLLNMGFGYKGAIHQKLDAISGELLFEDSLFEKL